MKFIPTIVLVLKTSEDFTFSDVQLIVRHINGQWKSNDSLRIICLWDKATEEYDLGNMLILPLNNPYPIWWSRMTIYGPEMERFRPFLYIDLDTAVLGNLEELFLLVGDGTQFIALEDFYQKGKFATGVAWVPAKSKKITAIWEAWVNGYMNKFTRSRMDYFLRSVTSVDDYWQRLTNKIIDAKPKSSKGQIIENVPNDTLLACFHGHPRIPKAETKWVRSYINQEYQPKKKKVTVIIPYKEDRGWLKDAIASVPEDVQLLVSQGEGNWPENFNKVLSLATGDYIKFLHEDDMLTENCIADSVHAFEETGADFIHGEAIEIDQRTKERKHWVSSNHEPTLKSMLHQNTIHSATLMYRKEVFEKIGGFDESLWTQEEYEFNLRCLKEGFKIAYVPAPLAYYRRHMAQKIRTVGTQARLKEKEMVKEWYND